MRKRGTELTTWLVGAYTEDMQGEAEGIVALRSRADGSLENLGVVGAAHSPSYLAHDNGTVFAVEEGAARLVEFQLGDDVTLTRRADVAAGGSEPCHIAVLDDAVIVSCYSGGQLGVHSRDPLALTNVLEATGSGPHPAQNSAHAHSSVLLSSGIVVSADLGADRIRVHELTDGTLTRVASLELPAGTGPRDIRELTDGTIVLLGELSNTVLFAALNESALKAGGVTTDGPHDGALSGDGHSDGALSTGVPGDGALRIDATVPIPGAEPGDHAAGLSLTADERFLFVTLRGSNRIGVIDVTTREPIGWVSAEGDWPRHHAIDDGVLHVANQKSSSVASFRVGGDGIPRLIADPTPVASPTFLLKLA